MSVNSLGFSILKTVVFICYGEAAKQRVSTPLVGSTSAAERQICTPMRPSPTESRSRIVQCDSEVETCIIENARKSTAVLVPSHTVLVLCGMYESVQTAKENAT